MQWRLIESPPADPYTNMAIDEALFESYQAAPEQPVLRFYQWLPAGISIGVTQKIDDVVQGSVCRSQGIRVVRRISGGEAIFHDQELTYSLVCAAPDLNLPHSIKESFRCLTSFLIDGYAALGITAQYAEDIPGYDHGPASAFCFATTERFDIIVDGKKLGGNAQKRNRRFIFQHGSIPLRFEPQHIQQFFKAPLCSCREATALETVCARAVPVTELRGILVDAFRARFKVNVLPDGLTPAEQSMAAMLRTTKYATDAWNYTRRHATANAAGMA